MINLQIQYVASTYVIDFEKLYEEGVRGLIFDIDNTLVPHGAPADERAKALFARLKAIGFRMLSDLRFRPGLTGLWQVSGRSNITDFEEVVKLDTQYIGEWSVKGDVKIIFKTFVGVLKNDGAV